jgi:hypothetical protein
MEKEFEQLIVTKREPMLGDGWQENRGTLLEETLYPLT